MAVDGAFDVATTIDYGRPPRTVGLAIWMAAQAEDGLRPGYVAPAEFSNLVEVGVRRNASAANHRDGEHVISVAVADAATTERNHQRLSPMLLNCVERSLANSAKPTAIVATITPAIRPYSKAVTARRSVFRDNQLEMYWIIVSAPVSVIG